jgi:preprotein translocase subunit SecD
MTLSNRPSVIISILFWLVITLYGAYFLANIQRKRLINFGIDLVGGLYLTLDVKVEEAIKSDLISAAQAIIEKLKAENKELPGVPKFNEKLLDVTLTFSSNKSVEDALKYSKDIAKQLTVEISQKDSSLILKFSPKQAELIKNTAIQHDIDVLRTRLDALGSGEIPIFPQGDRNIVIEMPHERDPEKAKARIGTSAVLEMKEIYASAPTKEKLVENLGGSLPEGTMIIPDRSSGDKPEKFYLVPHYAKITGKQLRGVRYTQQPLEFLSSSENSPHVVAFDFTSDGVKKFYEFTKANVGSAIAIILDNVVVSAASVKAAIEAKGGTDTVLSGKYFTEKSAKELVLLLKSGSFSAPVEVVEERQIGPSLGQESIRKGLLSCGIALGLLFVFSVTVYKTAGILAFIVLLYNLLLILLGLGLIPDATLTLPGIAGMILTIGMAIDSSILIYERIKEELALGASMQQAVKVGFNGATGVILDANVTTFIVGAVLYYFGSPAIQGFALTMMLGIIATLITGLLLLKTLFTIIFDVFGIQKIKI